MAEVTALKVASRPVDREVLELVEEVLARVKSGDVVAIAVVEVRPAGNVTFSYSHTDHYHALNSGCARLAARIASEPGDD